MQAVFVFIFGRATEGDGHDVVLAEEEATIALELLTNLDELGRAHILDGKEQQRLVAVHTTSDRVHERRLRLFRLFLHLSQRYCK